jgi:hypothetical protein
MAQEPRRAATGASTCAFARVAAAITAEAGHAPPTGLHRSRNGSITVYPFPAVARKRIARRNQASFGSDRAFSGESHEQPFVAGDVIEHADEKMRLARRLSDGFRSDAGDRLGNDRAVPARRR